MSEKEALFVRMYVNICEGAQNCRYARQSHHHETRSTLTSHTPPWYHLTDWYKNVMNKGDNYKSCLCVRNHIMCIQLNITNC